MTDSQEDLRERSLTLFFPESLEFELSRYPAIDALQQFATQFGFDKGVLGKASGKIPIDPELIDQLEKRCSSSLQVITEEAHRLGLQRVRGAAVRGRDGFHTIRH